MKNATFDISKKILGPVHLHLKMDKWDYLRSPIMKKKVELELALFSAFHFHFQTGWDNTFASLVFNKNFVRKPYRFIEDFCGFRVIVQIYSNYFRSILRVYLNKSSKTRAKTTSAWKAILYGLQITTAWNSTGHFIVLFQIFA